MHRPLPRRRRPGRLVLALLAAAGVLAACSDRDPGESSGSPSGAGTAAPSPSSPADGTAAGGGAGSSTTAAGAGSGTPAATGPIPDLTLAPIAGLDQPIALAPHPGTNDLYVAERAGRVRRIERAVDLARNSEQVRLVTAPVLDISSLVDTTGERGLLGLSFSADGSRLYVDYADRKGIITIVEYPMVGPDRADPAGARVLLTIDHSQFSNHNGGDVVPGPDGMLYVTVGDGGSGGDPNRNGQKLTTLLGKILRFDPKANGERPYTIPADNPYRDSPGGARPEIWVWGVRNPWRISFDRANGDLWVADVGQDKVEEIDRLPAADGAGRGANLGWNLMEGNRRFSGAPPEGYTGPVFTYDHGNGACSITGGYVYRGAAIPALAGTYLYSDYCANRVSGLRASGDAWTASVLPLNRKVENVISFGQDNDGELYVLEQGGRVSRLVPSTGGPQIQTRS